MVVITVLDVGFERGGVVTRLEHRGDAYVDEPYEVFAPRVLAGIEGLKETLEDRHASEIGASTSNAFLAMKISFVNAGANV